MFTSELALVGIALLIVGADIFVRLVLMPRRRDNFLWQLLDQLSERRGNLFYSKPVPSFVSTTDPLEESLLRHFEHCTVSRYILKEASLADLRHDQELLLDRLNRERNAARKTELPRPVFDSVVGILCGAGLVSINNGCIQLTRRGEQLARVLATRASR